MGKGLAVAVVGIWMGLAVLLGAVVWGAVEQAPKDKATENKGAPICRVLFQEGDSWEGYMQGQPPFVNIEYGHGEWTRDGVVFAYSATEDSTLYNFRACVHAD